MADALGGAWREDCLGDSVWSLLDLGVVAVPRLRRLDAGARVLKSLEVIR
jgi:hypothetical protein